MHLVGKEEIKKGDYITVMEWTNTNVGYVGDALEVLIVEHPFIIVNAVSHGDYMSNITLDTRKVKLRHVSEEFASLQKRDDYSCKNE